MSSLKEGLRSDEKLRMPCAQKNEDGRRKVKGGGPVLRSITPPTAMPSHPSSQAQQRPIYISSTGSVTQKPSILRQIEDFFLSLWELVVLFFKTLLEVSFDLFVLPSLRPFFFVSLR